MSFKPKFKPIRSFSEGLDFADLCTVKFLFFFTLIITKLTHSFIKSLQVDFLFGLSQLVLVVLTLDLQLVAHQRSGQIPVAWDFYDGNLTLAQI